MKDTLNNLLYYNILPQDEAYRSMLYITSGHAKEGEIASLLSAYVMRLPSLDEVRGFRRALLEKCYSVSFSFPTLDIVGTGGDCKNTFNISTLSAIVTAGAGIKVAKHGNYASTSVSGSSDVLERLGYKFSGDSNTLERQLETCNLCFLHAPLFHPALKNVAGVRKDIGVRTLFNLLGPLVNPAFSRYKVLGVSSPHIARLYHYLLQDEKEESTILYSTDGYDEISLTDSFVILSGRSHRLFHPEQLGLRRVKAEEIKAGISVDSAAKIFMGILKGEGSPAQQDVVIANSGFAIHTAMPHLPVGECLGMAKEALESGRAYQLFNQLIQLSR